MSDDPIIGNFSSSTPISVDSKSESRDTSRLFWQQAYFGNKREKFEKCGSVHWIERSESGELRVSVGGCNLRYCSNCRPRVYSKQVKKIKLIADRMEFERRKFITLTLKSTNNSLSIQLDNLTSSFRRLRQTKLWKSKVKYGVATIELTFNNKEQQWHPHMHIVCESDYLPQKALSKAWYRSSGGSWIVDVRRICGHKAINYVTKYVTKLPDISRYSNPEARASEIINACFNRRLIIKFGKVPKIPDCDIKGERFKPICTVDHLKHSMLKNEQWSIDLAVEIKETLGINYLKYLLLEEAEP